MAYHKRYTAASDDNDLTPATTAFVQQEILDVSRDWPYCHVRLATGVGMGTGVTTKIPYDTITKDTHSGWSLANDNYVIPEAGIYLITASAGMIIAGAGVVGEYRPAIYLNGSFISAEYTDTTAVEAVSMHWNMSTLWELAAAATVDVRFFQNTGSARTLSSGLLNGVQIKKVGDAPL
jgi:hypothetical protein